MFKKYLLATFALLAIVISSACSSAPKATKVTPTAPTQPEEQLSGIPTGDAYVLIVASNWGPDAGKFYRDNERLEKLGYVMNPDSVKLSIGHGYSGFTAVYHKKQ